MSTPPPPNASQNQDLRGVERLRDRIEAAVAEIERLREENAGLAERITKLSETAGGDPIALALDGDPAELREKVEGFIEAVDQMLAVSSDPSAPGGDGAKGPAS